ncbi:hypothetical protein H0H93_013680 [Arthromyces matolae]|nr:hypothetical protein H0H93_013680 [Arthromyces matolae]
MSTVSFPIKAKFVWSLIFDYDNTGNDGEIEQIYTFEESGKYTSKDFNQTVTSTAKRLAEQGHIKLEAGLSYGPVSASIGVGFESSQELSNMLQNTTATQSESTITYSRSEIRTCQYLLGMVLAIIFKSVFVLDIIGPRSRLCLYQRLFEGPGMGLQGRTTRTTPRPLTSEDLEQESAIDLTLAPQTFIKDIKVVYTDMLIEAPMDRVRANGQYSEDINFGVPSNIYPIRGVWLVPETTTKVSEALTRIDIFLTAREDPKYIDLSAGTNWRHPRYPFAYLVPVRQSDPNLPRLTQVALFRSLESKEPDLTDYAGRRTRNINEDRDGSGGFLYLLWNSQRSNPV